MEYKVLIAGDLHKRTKDITTIKNYMQGCKQVQLDLIDKIRKNNITHFISLGDWYDGGYGSDVAASLCHVDLDYDMAKIKMDSNPELFLIQPHPVFQSRHTSTRTTQIIRTPDRLNLNGTEFIFMHWNPLADNVLDYKVELDPSCNNHIALFHTEEIIPDEILKEANLAYSVKSSNAIADALNGVDIAIVGHIHKPLGQRVIKSPVNKDTLLIVPGSLTNTDSGLGSRHDKIDMPVITVFEDGSYKLEYLEQDLHTDMLTFYDKYQQADSERLKSLRGNTIDPLYEGLKSEIAIGGGEQFLTINRFMDAHGYTHADKVSFRAIINKPNDIDTLVYIYNEENTGL